MESSTIKAPIDLSHFTGTTAYHKLTMHPRVLFTDGLAYLAREAKCYWLMGVVMSHLATSKKLALEPFVSVSITTYSKDKQARCLFTDGNEKDLEVQLVKFVEFPFDKLSFFCQKEEQADGSRWIVMLPSEY